MNTLTFKMDVSDYHELGMVQRSVKGKPKKIFCHCYKNFDNEKLEEELQKLYLQC